MRCWRDVSGSLVLSLLLGCGTVGPVQRFAVQQVTIGDGSTGPRIPGASDRSSEAGTLPLAPPAVAQGAVSTFGAGPWPGGAAVTAPWAGVGAGFAGPTPAGFGAGFGGPLPAAFGAGFGGLAYGGAPWPTPFGIADEWYAPLPWGSDGLIGATCSPWDGAGCAGGSGWSGSGGRFGGQGRHGGVAEENDVAYRPAGSAIWRSK